MQASKVGASASKLSSCIEGCPALDQISTDGAEGVYISRCNQKHSYRFRVSQCFDARRRNYQRKVCRAVCKEIIVHTTKLQTKPPKTICFLLLDLLYLRYNLLINQE